jgi:hypothetical protein
MGEVDGAVSTRPVERAQSGAEDGVAAHLGHCRPRSCKSLACQGVGRAGVNGLVQTVGPPRRASHPYDERDREHEEKRPRAVDRVSPPDAHQGCSANEHEGHDRRSRKGEPEWRDHRREEEKPTNAAHRWRQPGDACPDDQEVPRQDVRMTERSARYEIGALAVEGRGALTEECKPDRCPVDCLCDHHGRFDKCSCEQEAERHLACASITRSDRVSKDPRTQRSEQNEDARGRRMSNRCEDEEPSEYKPGPEASTLDAPRCRATMDQQDQYQRHIRRYDRGTTSVAEWHEKEHGAGQAEHPRTSPGQGRLADRDSR